MGKMITLTAADGHRFGAYEKTPSSGEVRGGLVVVQEIFGVNDHIRQVADGFAAQGYLALAPSMFHRLKAGVDLGYGTDDMTAGRELKAAAEALPAPGVMADLQAAVNHAGAASGGKVGIVTGGTAGLGRATATLRQSSAGSVAGARRFVAQRIRRFTFAPDEEERAHRALALHVVEPAVLELVVLLELGPRLFGHVDPSRFAVALHA